MAGIYLVSPQQPGCLPAGDTAAALPAPATLPFQGAPGRTSSSGLQIAERRVERQKEEEEKGNLV